MFHKQKVIFIILFAMVLMSCNESKEDLEEKIAKLQKILDSQYAEEHKQAMEKCKELRKNPGAEPEEVAAAEKRVAETWSKMESTPPFLPVECKYKAPEETSGETPSDK